MARNMTPEQIKAMVAASHTPEANARRAASRARTLALKKKGRAPAAKVRTKVRGKRTRKEESQQSMRIPLSAVRTTPERPTKKYRTKRDPRMSSSEREHWVSLVDSLWSIIRVQSKRGPQ